MTSESETIAALQSEVAALQQRIADLEHENHRLNQLPHQAPGEPELAHIYITKPHQHTVLLEAFLDSLPAIIFAKDREGRFILSNQAFEQTFELETGSVIGKTLYDLFPESVADAMWKSECDVVETGHPVEVDIEVPQPDGMHVRHTIKFPIRDRRGSIYAIGGITTDITERKNIEERLRREQRLFLSGPIIVFKWVASETWPVEFVSPNIDQFGYTPDDFTSGRVPFASIVHPDDLERIAREVQTYSAEGRTFFEQDYRVLAANGDVRWVYDYTVVIRNMLGVITHYDGYLLDITERKRMVEDLHTFKAVAENAPDGICISDMDGVITYGNTAYNRLLGYSSTVGLHMADMATPDEQQRLPEIVHVLHQQGTWVGNYHYQRQDETQFIAQTSWSLMRDEHGHPRAIAAIIRDITEQRRAEEERTLLQQQVIEAQQNAIRELSTPLIPLAHNVVLMPLIGSIDTTRAQLVMETLLEGIAMHQADTAILDITGVSVVDTQVANALIQAAQAVRLLGAQVILTGIGPTMAQTLVHLGTDLSSIITRGSLQTAVVEAVQDHITAPVATRK